MVVVPIAVIVVVVFFYSAALVTTLVVVLIGIMPSFALFIFLILLVLFLLFFQRDTSLRLKLFETKGIVSPCLHGILLLLHDRKERVFTDFGCSITSGIGVLNGDEVLVCSAELKNDA